MMRQTLALFLDAYRELNARKLFWITLVLSVLVVGAYACIGINQTGVTILWFQMETSPFDSDMVPPRLFYSFIFSFLAVPFWLTWIATILALITTASLIPDFLSSGAVELSLSKPIRRSRLLLTKFLSGLLFAALQVVVFTIASFLVIGIRGGSWEFGIFLAVPIVILFFSYLYSISMLLALLTRSTMAALLLTLLTWFGLFSITVTDDMLLSMREARVMEVQIYERREQIQIEGERNELRRLEALGEEIPEGELANPLLLATREQLQDRRAALRRASRRTGLWTLLRTPMPKTTETIDYLGRSLISMEELEKIMNPAGDEEYDVEKTIDRRARGIMRVRMGFDDPAVAHRTEVIQRERGFGWTIGTSLGFELVVVGVCCLIFSRRDF